MTRDQADLVTGLLLALALFGIAMLTSRDVTRLEGLWTALATIFCVIGAVRAARRG
ncbi:MAG TPA: hypothetical protein VHT94_07310 [Streptosporangiaceae bacterium]|jgi:hypothetical protein|nr:hypothetical protein [Streptosporangiaceae bacterium]